jgi:hypothetical protein
MEHQFGQLSVGVSPVLFLPTASGSALSLSSAIASDVHKDKEKGCREGINHVKENKHSYTVHLALCEATQQILTHNRSAYIECIVHK